MSGLETLVPLIYHEKQQPGSQLCAQHALNVILQGDFFSAPDLAQFAQQLDALEGSFNDDAGPVSNNMDDTGFFSVEVLERALRVWGFTLVRWRSQDLRDQQEKPHAQMAFLLNHEQHWFSLRRFGSLADPDNGHWFNLNSFLKDPEWVGTLYLGMVLSQAEDEGYSVFAVLPTCETPDGPTILPHTEADDVASTLSQPTSSHMGARLSTSRVHEGSSRGVTAQASGFEDEDMELQAALQASLMGGEGEMAYAALAASRPPGPSASNDPFNARLPTPPSRNEDLSNVPQLNVPDPNDPVAVSMARNKAIMQRMLREQEMALREGYEEEVAFGFSGFNGVASRSGESSRSHQAPRARTPGEADEEAEIQRVIEESRRDGNQDEQEPIDLSDEEDVPPRPSVSEIDTGGPAIHTALSGLGAIGNRVYDDEDSELQAALKASLEGIPEGFYIPPTPPRPARSSSEPELLPTTQPKAAPPPDDIQENDDEEEPAAPEVIDAEEMRRRRLARFGGQS